MWNGIKFGAGFIIGTVLMTAVIDKAADLVQEQLNKPDGYKGPSWLKNPLAKKEE